jgi:hypothetical protein
MKVDGSLGSLLQGVSQQAARDRLDGQCTLQENISSDPVLGLTRRPPTDLVGFLGSASSVIGWHNFRTRDGRKYLAMYKPGDVDVFDLNADAVTTTVDGDASAYLSSAGSIRCATDAQDHTVVVNTEIDVAMTSSAKTYYNTAGTSAAIFQVLGGADGNKYTIYIDGSPRSYYKPPGGTEADTRLSSTEFIASKLMFGLLNNTGVVSGPAAVGATSGFVSAEAYGTGYCAGWATSQVGDLLLIKRPSAGIFTVSVTDGAGGVNFKACTDTVTDIADLPRTAPHYYAVRIAENTDPEKDLWFKFIAAPYEGTETPTSSGFGLAGYWKEAVSPNTNTAFDQSTMPHKLLYNTVAHTFQFSRESYDPRGVGTGTSNPDPSFVGNKINDVSASFQGRIVFLSGSNVVMSRTNKPTNFWRGSATALADTDPIDINSTVESSQMLACVQHNKDLVIFTRKGQHIVFGRTGLTPSNASLVLTTQFESELQAHPVAAGKNIFFGYNFGRYTGIREFFAEGSTDANDSRPVTEHVNKYLVGKITRLTASANYNIMLSHTDAEQTDVYSYQYIWQDAKKVQSAWSTWKFSKDIVYSFFDEDVIYLVQRVGTDYYLLRCSLEVQSSPSMDYPVFLDQRFDVPGCNTAFVLPYDYLHTEQLVCVQGEGCPTPGLSVSILSVVNVPGTGYVVTLKRDMNGGNVIVGTRYKSRYKPTMPSVKDQNGVVMSTAKVTARSFLVTLYDTGEINGIVRSKYGDGPEVSFNARIVGDVENIVGEQALSDGKFTLPFKQDVKDAEVEFYTDSHLPMTIADIEWVGQYNKRGRRIANSGGKQ